MVVLPADNRRREPDGGMVVFDTRLLHAHDADEVEAIYLAAARPHCGGPLTVRQLVLARARRGARVAA